MSGKESAGRGKDKSHIQCFNCHKYRHYVNRCPSKKNGDEAHHVKAEGVEQLQALMLTVLEEVKSGGERLARQKPWCSLNSI